MTVICPTVLAHSIDEFNTQIKRVTPFAKRIQIDLTDGEFVGPPTLLIKDVWWPHKLTADLHLMYARPTDYLDQIIDLRPNLVVIHAEATVHHMHMAAELHKVGIKAGLAILPETPVSSIEQILHSFDHLLIFGGHLGQYGGQADLSQLEKAKQAKVYHDTLEIGWDGGVNDQNARQIAESGVDVLNAGGFIQKSESPAKAFAKLEQIIA